MADAVERLKAALADCYRIERELGAGGMATVYLAEDLKHHRKVAVKVLHPELAAVLGAERFLAEIQTTANLQHPHILPLHDSGQADGLLFYVMPNVEGETLRARLTREQQLPIDDAVRITKEVASALDYAHRHGVIHRDIKPENILLHEGQALIADFGIALAVSTAGGQRMTQTGISLGTPEYMSPEQALGERAITAKSDVYALGCVLYEMLTGDPPFTGSSVQAIVAKVMHERPVPPSSIRETIPAHFETATLRALAKLPADRFASAGEFAEALANPTAVTAPAVKGRAPSSRAARMLPWGIAIVSIGAGVALALARNRVGGSRVVTHALLDVLPADELNSGVTSTTGTVVHPGGARTALAWSPDGKALAFIGRKSGGQLLYVRQLNSDAAQPLSGTEGATNPAFSPDGQWIAFSVPGEIRKIGLGGGPPVKLCSLSRSELVDGIAWGAGRVVYAGNRRLWSFSPATATCDTDSLTSPQAQLIRHTTPHLLPKDEAVLYTENDQRWSSGRERVMVKRLSDGATRELLPEAADARYLATGHLVFLRQGTLFRVGFDAKSLTTVGQPVPVLGGVSQVTMTQNASDLTLAGQYAISSQGDLAYVRSPPPAYPDVELVAVDRSGIAKPLPGVPSHGYVNYVRLSADGSRLALEVSTGKDVTIHVFDNKRSTLTPLAGTEAKEASGAVWSPIDGRIATELSQGGKSELTILDPGGTSPPHGVAGSAGFEPTSWSKGGERIAGIRDGDIWILSLGNSPKLESFLKTSGEERSAAWSPDGRYLTYASNEGTDRFQVYVRAYPGLSPAVQISLDGGLNPTWSRDGREIFFVRRLSGQDQAQMMSVQVSTTPELRLEKPQLLFSFDARLLRFTSIPGNGYDVAPDGRTFFVTEYLPKPQVPVTHINLILSWLAELKGKGMK